MSVIFLCKAKYLIYQSKLDLKLKADSLTCIAKYTYWTGTITGTFETKNSNVLCMYFLVAHLCPKTYYVKRKNQKSLINQVKIWYLFLSINTHVYSPVTCYIMLCVPQDTIIPCCWIPIKFTIFSFHQLCSFLTFIMLAWTNVAISYVH